jgi:hypothetical protein
MSAFQHNQGLLNELLVWLRSSNILTVKRSAMKLNLFVNLILIKWNAGLKVGLFDVLTKSKVFSCNTMQKFSDSSTQIFFSFVLLKK